MAFKNYLICAVNSIFIATNRIQLLEHCRLVADFFRAAYIMKNCIAAPCLGLMIPILPGWNYCKTSCKIFLLIPIFRKLLFYNEMCCCLGQHLYCNFTWVFTFMKKCHFLTNLSFCNFQISMPWWSILKLDFLLVGDVIEMMLFAVEFWDIDMNIFNSGRKESSINTSK